MYQEANENLEDAGNELILSDEDVVRFQIGEVFAHMPVDDVEARLEQMRFAVFQFSLHSSNTRYSSIHHNYYCLFF